MLLQSPFLKEMAGLVIACLALTLLGFASLTSSPPGRDGKQYTALAYNLAVHGIYSKSNDDSPHRTPAMRRPPAFPAVAASGLYLFGPKDMPPVSCIQAGKPGCAYSLFLLKSANVLINLLMALAAYLTVRIWLKRVDLAAIAFALVAVNTSLSSVVDGLNPEPLAALLLLVASGLTTSALISPRYRYFKRSGGRARLGRSDADARDILVCRSGDLDIGFALLWQRASRAGGCIITHYV